MREIAAAVHLQHEALRWQAAALSCLQEVNHIAISLRRSKYRTPATEVVRCSSNLLAQPICDICLGTWQLQKQIDNFLDESQSYVYEIGVSLRYTL